jgi:polysaccharide pyruvyl transferase WcaK-like protein
VGDKAILWSIVRNLKNRGSPPAEIAVASMFPFITNWTKREMELPEIRVVETWTREFEAVCNGADEIIMGGGPLMDLEPLNSVLFAFAAAASRGAVARVEGCGIGPLESPLYQQVVGEILRLSSHASLRDRASVSRCLSEFGRQAQRVKDPACEFLTYAARQPLKPDPGVWPATERPVANFFLRELPAAYVGEVSEGGFDDLTGKTEEQLLRLMGALVEEHGWHLNLLPMSHFFVGGDDRVLNRRLARRLNDRCPISEGRISVSRLPVSPYDVVAAMQRATLNVCMRFHAVCFAHVLKTDFLAIDYTGGGKVRAFLEDEDAVNRLITLRELCSGSWREPLSRTLQRSGKVAF